MISIEEILVILKGWGTDDQPITIGILKGILKDIAREQRLSKLRNKE